jgi:glyoxylase-like metal-dependent hydrolase (beta-lactamase superfamily II)
LYDLERRTIVDALHEVGVAPEAITHVVVTHLHFDHAGGLTRWDSSRRAIPTFPQAPIFVQRTEWQDALANKSTMTRTYLREHLDPIAERVQLLDGATAIAALPGISVFPVPGHTWGMQAVTFEDAQGTVCFPGDVLPTVNHAGLAFSIGYDMEAYQNMLTKKALLARAALERWRIVLDHEPGEPVVRVLQNPHRPGHFALEPAHG